MKILYITSTYQVDISREPANRLRGSYGNIMYSAIMFRDNIQGTVDYFANYIYPYPALQPEYPWLAANFSSTPIPAPKIQVINNGNLYVNLDKSMESRLINQIAIYKLEESKWNLFKVLPMEERLTNMNIGLEFAEGNYVATLVDRFGRESMKTYFEI